MNTTGCQGLATVGSQWKTSVSAVFFLSCMEMEDKKTVPACRLLSVHLPGLSDLCLVRTYTLTYRSPGVLANQILEDQSGFCLYLFCLSLFYFPRYKSQTTHARTVRHGSSSFPGQSVNKVSTVSSPPTFTAKDERPKGQISWQQGDVVLRSIVPLSRIWRCQTLKIRLKQTLVTLIVQ